MTKSDSVTSQVDRLQAQDLFRETARESNKGRRWWKKAHFSFALAYVSSYNFKAVKQRKTTSKYTYVRFLLLFKLIIALYDEYEIAISIDC